MATLDDILTTQKNGVVAINNINQTLTSFYNKYAYVAGSLRSATVTSRTQVAVGSGRLVAIVVVVKGSADGFVYDSRTPTITTATDNGTTATITYVGSYAVAINDTVVITGNSVSAYNISAVVNGVGTGAVTGTYTLQFPLTPNPGAGTGGLLFNQNPANVIATSPTAAVGVYQVGSPFSTGLVIAPGTGQSVNVIYSLD